MLCAGGASFDFKRIHEIYPNYSWDDLLHHPALVLIPYQTSTMFFFEARSPLAGLTRVSGWHRRHLSRVV